jgi:deoxycitidine kinase
MLHESGDISQEQFEIYNRWFDEFLGEVIMTGIIYLKTEPSVCFERCTTRARKGENVISLDYLTKCSDMHNTWLLEDDFIPTLELHNNADEEIEEVEIFIKSEMSYYEVRPQDSKLFQLASLVGLAIIITGYIVKVGYIVLHITS